MATFGSVIKKVNALRYMFDQLDIKSSLGRRVLLAQHFITGKKDLFFAFESIDGILRVLETEKGKNILEKIQIKLEHINDIQGTINNLYRENVLDDIELFEIKNFALIATEIRELATLANYFHIEIPVLESPISILDPQGQRVPHFYVYDEYSEELSSLRKQQKSIYTTNVEQAEKIRLQAIAVEDTIREKLSRELFKHKRDLRKALEMVALFDIVIAKALLAVKYKLAKPSIADEITTYKSLFNPYVQDSLSLQSKSFQAVDITIGMQPLLITGANMGGKTVLLKSVQLAQYMFQFGFYIPANQASIVPVEDVMTSMSDEQSELSGLSSFASEMIKVNEIIKAAKAGKNILVLIDELARTTNPQEGRAIVNAILDVLASTHARSLVTTHYSGIQSSCRKMRVKGLMTEKLNQKITTKNINDYMDYSLVENDSADVPMEALAIAKILEIDEDVLQQAAFYAKN